MSDKSISSMISMYVLFASRSRLGRPRPARGVSGLLTFIRQRPDIVVGRDHEPAQRQRQATTTEAKRSVGSAFQTLLLARSRQEREGEGRASVRALVDQARGVPWKSADHQTIGGRKRG